jgi:acetyltransferase-like isoleucine patch superfamily enzyme
MEKISPKVSIITASFNCWSELEKSIRSVRALNYPNIEHIVIDGASVDGTSIRIKDYLDKIAVFVSEKDTGIASAWNKGINRATGKYICFLNSGDEYHPEFINHSINALGGNIAALSYGITYMLSNEGYVTNKIDAIFDRHDVASSFGFLHTCIFTSKEVYQKVGNFNEEYKIALDIDWLLRALNKKIEFIKSSAKNYMVSGGVSELQKTRARKEYNDALIANGFLNNSSSLTGINLKFFVIRLLEACKAFEIRRHTRSQAIFILLALLNFVHRYTPFFIFRRLVHRIAGFDVHKTAAVQNVGEFFAFKRLKIGEGTVINKNFKFDNRMGIKIGANVSIAHDVSIYTLGHDINCDAFGTVGSSVSIDDHVVIFAGATIMPGVSIGKGAVVYPGSVVTKDVDPMTVVGGNPAKAIKFRESKLKYRLDYKYWFAH